VFHRLGGCLEKFVEFCFCFGGFPFLERQWFCKKNGKKRSFFAKTEKTTKGNVLPVLCLLHLGGGSKFPENLRL
jgi:hypothetical protein